MPKYRATVWFLHSLAESNADISRHIYEERAESPEMFKAEITDRLVTFSNVDNEIWFGPISKCPTKQTN